jgi:hypothetical protein
VCCEDSNVGQACVMTLMELDIAVCPRHFVMQMCGGSGVKCQAYVSSVFVSKHVLAVRLGCVQSNEDSYSVLWAMTPCCLLGGTNIW